LPPPLRPELLRRYAEIARVLARHGGHDLVRSSGLADALSEPAEAQGAPDDAEQRAEDEAARDLAADLESLGPTFVKLGQLLSTRADLLSDAHIEALSRLQDDVEPVPFDEIRAVVEQDLGARLSNVYESFDEVPIASASLGQVHHAVLRNGREVAVKVQRPGIRETVARDLEVLHGFAKLLDDHTDAGERYHFDEMIDEFERSLIRELDYRREAVSLGELRRNLGSFERLTVPDHVEGLTTSRVLTMDHVEGIKVTSLSGVARIDLDGEALVDELFRAYLQQMLSDGFVHADPHPGNVLLTPDHRLALIDVGMVVRLDPTTRERMLRLLLAVADGEGDTAADVALAMGRPTSFFDEEAFRRDVSALVGSYHDLPPGASHAGQILAEVTRISGQDGVRPPAELTLLGRTLLALDQVAGELAPDFDADAAVREHAGQVLRRTMFEELTPSSMMRGLLDTKEFVEQFPGRANRILGSLADGSMRVRIDAVDAERLIGAIQRLANRLVAGLVLAALIVGAAMLSGVETEATILGYPALALVFFVVAGLMGFWLVVTILRNDE
jgi:ubiquinone biosynthesis protein